MRKFFFILVVFSLFLISCDNVLYNVAEGKKDMQKLIWTNANGDSVDLTSGNFGITEWSGFSGTELNIQSQQVPFHDGSVYLDGLLSERELSVTLAMDAKNDLEKRYRLRRELIEILNPKLGEGYLIYRNDYTAKRIKCVPQIPLFDNCNSNDSGTPKASLAWTACDPYWEDLEETVVDISSGLRTVVNNSGDVETQMKLKVFSSYCENPEIVNYTNNKKIKLNGTFRNSFEVNTGFGQKNILAENIDIHTEKTGMDINAIAYSKELDKYVAVGEWGLILRSKNSVDWDSMHNDTSNLQTHNDIISVEGFGFIGVGGYCRIIKSVDGETWEQISVDENGDFFSIAYSTNRNIFVTVGINTSSNGIIYTSTDGTTWNSVNISSGRLLSVAYSEKLDLFVAVGENGNILTSADGSSWTTRSSGVTTYFRYVSYEPSIEQFIISSNNTFLLTSSNGINWSVLNIDVRILRLRQYRNSMFLGINSDGKIFSSLNLTNWNEVGSFTFLTTINWGDLLFTPQTGFVFVVSENGSIFRSGNGEDWENISYWGQNARAHWTGVKKFNNKLFCYGQCVSGSSSSAPIWGAWSIYSEQNGTWEDHKTGYIGNVTDIEYVEELNRYIFIGDCGVLEGNGRSIIYFDYDNFWIPNITLQTTNMKSMAHSKSLGLFVAVGENGTILTSSDGSDWTSQTSGVSVTLNKIIWINNLSKFVIVGNSGTLLTSSDGITWESVNLNTLTNIITVAYSNDLGQIVAINSNRQIFISADSETWSLRESNDSLSNCVNLYYIEDLGLFVFVGYKYIRISSDAIHWNTYNVLYTNGIFYDEEEKVMYSVGHDAVLLKIYFDFKNNMTNYLSSDSDMNFILDKDGNELVLSCERGTVYGKLYYRQKYVGV